MKAARNAALTCFAAAAAWPVAMTEFASTMMSPLERAARASWCGVPAHDASAVLGHCAACWAGSAAFFALGVWLLQYARTAAIARRTV